MALMGEGRVERVWAEARGEGREVCAVIRGFRWWEDLTRAQGRPLDGRQGCAAEAGGERRSWRGGT
jgi:hypothetical protein